MSASATQGGHNNKRYSWSTLSNNSLTEWTVKYFSADIPQIGTFRYIGRV